MDTQEARWLARDMALQALEIVQRLADGRRVMPDERLRLRKIGGQLRELLPDAGYPAEAVWRGVQRSIIGLDTADQGADSYFWQDVAADLRRGMETLSSLVQPAGSQPDVNLVG
ncbi:MAG: hypothetical protein ACRDFS_11225 [Chloroflexota bacterium]